MNTPPIKAETQYNLLVQLDYLAGLFTAVMLGRATENNEWSLFAISLAVSLGLGWFTVKTWVRTMRSLISPTYVIMLTKSAAMLRPIATKSPIIHCLVF